MYNVALRIVNDPDDAEDILQESFFSAFQNLESFEGKSTFGAWLKRIVINNALTMLKSKKLQLQPLTVNEEDVQDNEEVDEEDLTVGKIKSALKELAPGFRTVVSLYLFEGYDHQEIAEILNISESTSKTQYKRGKSKLLELLNETRDV